MNAFRFFLLFLLGVFLPASAMSEPRVVDGDTLEIEGVTYRLNGIDVPEHGQRCGEWRCGVEATNALAELVRGKDVVCDPHFPDNYGRVVATCYVDGRDLSAEMINKGLAWAFIEYSDVYVPEELVSKDKAEGVFSEEFTPPWEFRDKRWKRAEAKEQKAPPGCPIKGNISHGSNEKIYHMPWSRSYDITLISPEKGERWFCDEAEALAAGWRAPYWK